MIAAGLPVVDVFSQHHATPLHWAGWHGNLEMIRMILARNPQIENTDNDYKDTPLGWTIHGSENGWAPEKGDYAGAVEALLDAGAALPGQLRARQPSEKFCGNAECANDQRFQPIFGIASVLSTLKRPLTFGGCTLHPNHSPNFRSIGGRI